MKSGSRLEQVLSAGLFAVTTECGPPKSADVDVIRRKADYFRGVVDAANVTDCQTAVARLSSVAGGALLQSFGVEAVLQSVTRDRNRLALQSDLLGAWALGLKNILCLTGDPAKVGNHPDAKEVFDLNSSQLIKMLVAMREDKKFLNGEEMKVNPRFFIGAAASPCAEPVEKQVDALEAKLKDGADFVQTQAVYDVDLFRKFMDEARARGLHAKAPILAGIVPLKSAKMAHHMHDNVWGITIPQALLDRMDRTATPEEDGVAIAVDLIQAVRATPGVGGVHIMAVEWEKMVPVIVEKAGLLPRPEVAEAVGV